MEVYAELDLHATNTYVAMVDQENKVLYKQRHRNELPAILAALDPFKKDMQGVVVETGSFSARNACDIFAQLLCLLLS